MVTPLRGRAASVFISTCGRILGFFIVYLFISVLPGFSQEALLLNDSPGEYSLDLFFSYLEDPTRSLTIEEISGPEYIDKFLKNTRPSPNFGYTKSDYWLRFTVKNMSERYTAWILRAEYIWHRDLDLYIPDGEGGFLAKKTGHVYPMRNQDLKNSRLLFDFSVDRGAEKTLYLRVRSNEAMILSFKIFSYNRFNAQDHESQLLYGLYYGVLLIMVFYNFVLFFFFRDRAFIYYSLWVFFLILMQLQANGLYYEYLAPFVRPWLSFDPYYIIRGCGSIFIILFIRVFLKTRRYTPLLHKITYVFLGVYVFLLFAEFFIPAWIIDGAFDIIDPVLGIMGLFLSAAALKKGSRMALFSLIGFGLPVPATIIANLSASGIIPFSPSLINLDQAGNLFTILFFSFVLGYYYRAARREKEYLERLNTEQTNFFINLSHEIKTPLTLISGYLREYIQKHGGSPELEIMERNIEKLRRDMINFFDILKFNKGRLVYNHNYPLNLSLFLEKHLELYYSAAAARNITVSSEIIPNVFIKANPQAMDRILNNLLDNALRYNRPGGDISIKLVSLAGNAELSVANTGESIEPEFLSHIFEPFFQLKKESSVSQGIGMGLAIVKQITNSLGGTIQVKSSPDDGCAFILRFSLCGPAETVVSGDEFAAGPWFASEPFPSAEETAIGPERTDRSVLVVEDNRDLLSLLKKSLSPFYIVHSASNGAEALKVLNTLIPYNKPDVIVSDIMMKEMNGIELLKEIRKEPALEAIPFVFITARTDPQDKIEGLSGGAVDYIFKPFLMPELKAKIDALLRLKDAEDKLKVQEKFASLGLLMGSVSHEIFNPLSGIRGPLTNLRKLLDSSGQGGDPKILKHLNFIEESVYAIEKIIRNVALLVSEADLPVESVLVSEVAGEALKDQDIRGDGLVEIIMDVPEGAEIKTNRNGFYHILRNVVSNAQEAMPEGGTIRIFYRGDSGKGRLSVSDTGTGIAEENLSRIFEPFFSTFPSGPERRGRGLGLFIVRTFCERMGWEIAVDSGPSGGTEIRFTIPQ